jgi:hypothetical protein
MQNHHLLGGFVWRCLENSQVWDIIGCFWVHSLAPEMQPIHATRISDMWWPFQNFTCSNLAVQMPISKPNHQTTSHRNLKIDPQRSTTPVLSIPFQQTSRDQKQHQQLSNKHVWPPPKKYKNGFPSQLFLFVAPPFLPLPGPPSALSGTAPVVRRRPPELSQDVSSLVQDWMFA